mgnify:CR=1 FL=1
MKQQIIFLGLLTLLFANFGNAQDRSYLFDEATGNWGTSLEQNYATLVANPTDAFLGIESSTISKAKANKLGFSNPYGSYVQSIFKNTAAHEAGILPFDYIYGIGEYRTTRQSTLSDLLDEYAPEDWVDLHLIRDGRKMKIQAQLDYEKDIEENEEEGKSAFLGISRRGQSDLDLDGVPVDIVDNSTAKAMGMEDGDKIIKINGYPILDWNDVSTAIATLQPNQEISVTFTRDGQTVTCNRAIKSYEETKADEPIAFAGHSDDEVIYGSVEQRDPIQHHESAFLGINIASLSRSKAEKLGFDNPYGTYVSSIVKNSAADKGGMKPLDYIYGIDEYRVGASQNLTDILGKYRAGDNAVILVSRKDKRKSISVRFGSRDDNYGHKKEKNKCEDPFFGITSSSYERISIDGVRVNVVKNATSKDVGMQNGDVIIKINGYRMVDWTDIGIAINMMKPGEIITVNYVRDGQEKSGNAPVKSYAETKNCADCNCYHKKPINLSNDNDNDFSYQNNTYEDSDIEINIMDANSRDLGEFSIKGISQTNNNLAINDLNIKSNASKGLFELSFDLPSSGATVVKVFNDKGRNIYEYDLGRFSGEFQDELNLMQNGKGSYLLNISQDGKVVSKKIVIR